MGRKNKTSFWIEYLLAWFGKSIFLVLPWSWAQRVGSLLGLFSQYLLPKRRKVVLDNLKLSFPKKNEQEIEEIARRVWINVGLTAAEFIKIKQLNKQNLFRYVEIEGEDYLQESLKAGKGVIILSAHFANWEMVAAALALKGYPLGAIARPLKNPLVDRLVNSIRQSSGAKIFFSEEAMSESLSWLKMNRLVYILIDQRITAGSMRVDFFTRPAATSPIIALLAKRTGAAVLPVYGLRDNSDRLKIIIKPAVELKTAPNIREELLLNTTYFTKIIESWIRENPGLWFWLHTRWERRL